MKKFSRFFVDRNFQRDLYFSPILFLKKITGTLSPKKGKWLILLKETDFRQESKVGKIIKLDDQFQIMPFVEDVGFTLLDRKKKKG